MDKKTLGKILIVFGCVMIFTLLFVAVYRHNINISYMEGAYSAIGDGMCERYDLGPLNNGYCDTSIGPDNFTAYLTCSWVNLMINRSKPELSLGNRYYEFLYKCETKVIRNE